MPEGNGVEISVTNAAKSLVDKLNKKIAMGEETTAFSIALLIAVIKDSMDIILDLAIIGLFPIIGQLIGYFVSTFLFFFLLGKGWILNKKLKIMYWILGFFFDNLPLFNALPVSTLNVLYAWRVVRKNGEKAKKTKAMFKELTEKQIEELNNEAF
jgi:hypothetical protein